MNEKLAKIDFINSNFFLNAIFFFFRNKNKFLPFFKIYHLIL